jgi:hypothetical protein
MCPSESLESNDKSTTFEHNKYLYYNTMYIIMCVFTYTCSQKHNNLSDSITM